MPIQPTDLRPEGTAKAALLSGVASIPPASPTDHHACQRITGVPKYAAIPRACDITGLGRSTIYKLAGDGTLRLVKAGNRTLVDMEHALAWMATLPVAQIALAHKPAV